MPTTAKPKPPVPLSTGTPKSWRAPSIHPLRISGSVIQLGTFNAQPSMNAARIMPRLMTTSGPALRPVGQTAAHT